MHTRPNNHLSIIRFIYLLCCCAIVSPALAAEIPTSLNYMVYKLATENNDSGAQYLLGKKYYLGTSVKKDLNEAVKWLRKAADGGERKAQYLLGKLYLYGDEGLGKNYIYAHELLSKAAAQGETDAQYELANFYMLGINGPRQYKEAIKWYRAAIRHNHSGAQYQLGKIFYDGEGIKQDAAEAKRLLQAAADNGELSAQKYLVILNPKPPAPAIKETSKAEPAHTLHLDRLLIDAGNGDVDAQFTVGKAYLTGDNAPQKPEEAARWLRKAAEQNHAGAQYQLAQLYSDGIGVTKSEPEAIKWLRLAASWGINQAQQDLESLLKQQAIQSDASFPATSELSKPSAQYALGMMYAKGQGADKDPTIAAQWFMKAARQSHLEAQFELGKLYLKGQGVEADPTKAKQWLGQASSAGLVKASQTLRKLLHSENERIIEEQIGVLSASPIYPHLQKAKQGDTEAQFQVGLMYLGGKNTAKDIQESIRWLQIAALDDHLKAQKTLADIYLRSTEIERDYLTASKWLSEAADNNDADAQYQLGLLYKDGLGVSQDKTQALHWLRKAARQGHEEARGQLGGCRVC